MKLQVALEYMMVFAFVIVMFMAIFVTIASQRASVSNEELNSHLQLVAESIASQLNTAQQGGSGYSASVQIPSSGSLLAYGLNITKSGEIVVTAQIGTETESSVSYSLAGTITSNPSFVNANNAYSYSIPTANGTLVLQNAYGTLCVDYACPSVANQTGAMSVSQQVVHAAQFNGAGYLDITPAVNPATMQFTESGWVYFSSPGNNQVPLGSKISGAAGSTFYIGIWSATGASSTQISCGLWGSSWAFVNTGVVPVANTWYHVAMEESSNQISCYVNGVNDGSAAVPASITTPSDLYIGRTYQTYFNGDVSNVQLYNSALSGNIVASLYNEGIAGTPLLPANVVGWWQLNGNAKDYGGLGNNGNTIGSVVYPTVTQIFAKVRSHSGAALSNTLVGFSSTLGAFNGNKAFLVNYTNSNGIATAFLTQNLTNGYADVQTTAFNGNSLTQNTLVGWWPLVEGSGSQAYDISGNGNTGALYNASWSSPSFVTSFDGLHSYVQIPNSANTQISTATITGWINIKGPPSATWNWLVAKAGAWGVGVCGTNFAVCYYDWGGTGTHTSSVTLTPNKWYFMAAVIAGGTETIYVNGVNVLSGSDSVSAQTVPMDIGYGNCCSQYLNGSVANIQLYNTGLSSNQINTLYDQGISATPILQVSLVGWWPLNGDSADHSIHGLNGTGVNTYTNVFNLINASNSSITPVTVGSFNGVSKAFVGNTIVLQPETGISVSVWANITASQTGSPMLVSDSPPASNGGYNLSIVSGKPTFTVRQFGYGWGACRTTGTSSVITGGATQIVGTYNGSGIAVYVNGNLQANSLCNANSLSTFVNYSINSNATIGLGYNGRMGNVQVYSTALSAKNISYLYGRGQAGFPLPQGSIAGWYPLEGNTNDYSTYQNNGTATNLAYVSQSAFVPSLSYSLTGGYGVQFNNLNSYIHPSSNALPTGSQARSAFAWVYVPSYPPPSYSAAVLGWDGSGTGGWNQLFVTTTGSLQFSGSSDNYFPTYPIVPLNSWTFVGFMYSAGSTNITLCANTQCSTGPLNGHAALDTLSGAPFYIGSFQGGSGDSFNGVIANVQIYDAALNASQEFQLYHNQVPPSVSTFIPLSVIP